jgi:hypothetical protein
LLLQQPQGCWRSIPIASPPIAAVAASTAAEAAAAAATTTAVATATATPSPAASAATTATEATAAAAAVFARAGFVHGEGAAVVLLAIKPGDRRLGLFIGAHLDETESLAAAGVAVVDDLGGNDLAVCSEQLLEL